MNTLYLSSLAAFLRPTDVFGSHTEIWLRFYVLAR